MNLTTLQPYTPRHCGCAICEPANIGELMAAMRSLHTVHTTLQPTG